MPHYANAGYRQSASGAMRPVVLGALLLVAAARAGKFAGGRHGKHAPRLRIMVVGLSKSGTTSVQSMLTTMGLNVAKHLPGLSRNDGNWSFPDIFEGEWDAVINSAPWSYRNIHRNYPGVRFVVAKRSAPDEWLKSAAKHFCFTTWEREDGNYDEYRTTRFEADHFADVYKLYYANWDNFVAETLDYEPIVVDVERAGNRSYVKATWRNLAKAARAPLPENLDLGLFPFSNSRATCCFKHSFSAPAKKGGVFVQTGPLLDPMCRDMAGACGVRVCPSDPMSERHRHRCRTAAAAHNGSLADALRAEDPALAGAYEAITDAVACPSPLSTFAPRELAIPSPPPTELAIPSPTEPAPKRNSGGSSSTSTVLIVALTLGGVALGVCLAAVLRALRRHCARRRVLLSDHRRHGLHGRVALL
mmetsp:Transcript_2619/g.7640  ORF Transcript_2619/g.7640 Transcript_2619/m.7640 type:complete len:417 (+) Transcript_2619:464-1714(+)